MDGTLYLETVINSIATNINLAVELTCANMGIDHSPMARSRIAQIMMSTMATACAKSTEELERAEGFMCNFHV